MFFQNCFPNFYFFFFLQKNGVILYILRWLAFFFFFFVFAGFPGHLSMLVHVLIRTLAGARIRYQFKPIRLKRDLFSAHLTTKCRDRAVPHVQLDPSTLKIASRINFSLSLLLPLPPTPHPAPRLWSLPSSAVASFQAVISILATPLEEVHLFPSIFQNSRVDSHQPRLCQRPIAGSEDYHQLPPHHTN